MSKKKVVLVTGGNSGIGLACVKHFLANDTQVIATGRREVAALNHLDEKDKALLSSIDYQAMDVSKEEDILKLFKHIQESYGHLDIAVNNAGVAGVMGKPFHEVTIEEYDHVMDINQKAVWRCMQEEVQLMLPHNNGSIINISSVAGLKASKISALYGMSKFAVNGLTRAAAAIYADQGIRINSVCPAAVNTPLMYQDPHTKTFLENAPNLIPLGRAGKPDDVANLVLWLSSDEASWMTGNVVPIDGGLTA